MSLKDKAQETLKILEDGGFTAPSGEWVDMREQIEFSVSNSTIYKPEQFEDLTRPVGGSSGPPAIEVTPETTQIAAGRLVREGCRDLALLNYASARNPGGGFINGAKAQEEDLARCSALYKCLISQKEYYEVNRRQASKLYTDHVIYSPKVPWFRLRARDDPEEVFLASVITAPAPNARQALRHGDTREEIEAAMRRRCGQVLGVARHNGHRNLLLGAWGCGVFGNDPAMVANAFNVWIHGPEFASAFDRVVFAIYDTSKERSIYEAFNAEFPRAGATGERK